MAKPLAGQVAVVAGATRGAGRGIACMLGEAGATVYCTGRSVRGHPSPIGRPETNVNLYYCLNKNSAILLAHAIDRVDPHRFQGRQERDHEPSHETDQ